MLIDTHIEILINNKNITKYKELGYDVKSMHKCLVKISDLSIGSMVKVRAKCEYCFSVNEIIYSNYMMKQMPKHGFYVCKNCSSIKVKLTSIKKYGVESYSMTDECKEKVVSTSLLRYNVTNYRKTDDYERKVKETSLINYGVNHYTQSDIVKNKRSDTNIERYGSSSPDFGRDLEKIKKTNIEKYGVEYPMHNKEIFSKFLKNSFNVKYTYGLYYQSTYELDFINFCKIKNIIVENCVIVFDYMFNDKNKKYYPDFYLPEYNTIIEIKSKYFYNKDFERNLEKEKSITGYNFLFIIDKDYTKINELKCV